MDKIRYRAFNEESKIHGPRCPECHEDLVIPEIQKLSELACITCGNCGSIWQIIIEKDEHGYHYTFELKGCNID